MSKRHILTTDKQYKGQYFTTVADKLLNGWEHYVEGKDVVDPFVGAGDLIAWARGCNSSEGYDIDPQFGIENDSLMNPPSYEGKFLLTNPPFLSSNKCRTGDKRPYKKWGQSDYYKCHLASLVEGNCQEGIIILPSNFISESNAKARTLFFSNFEVLELRYWREPTFEDTNTGIVALVFRRAEKANKRVVPTTVYPSYQSFDMVLELKYKWLWGQDFFDRIEGANDYEFIRCTSGTPTTNIIVGSLDHGKYATGFHYNEGEPLVVSKSVITTYQMTTDFEFSEEEQRAIVETANSLLEGYREQYSSMFMSNYLGAVQKIMSQSYAKGLLNAACDIVLEV